MVVPLLVALQTLRWASSNLALHTPFQSLLHHAQSGLDCGDGAELGVRSGQCNKEQISDLQWTTGFDIPPYNSSRFYTVKQPEYVYTQSKQEQGVQLMKSSSWEGL